MAQKIFWRLLEGSIISDTRLAEKEVAGFKSFLEGS